MTSGWTELWKKVLYQLSTYGRLWRGVWDNIFHRLQQNTKKSNSSGFSWSLDNMQLVKEISGPFVKKCHWCYCWVLDKKTGATLVTFKARIMLAPIPSEYQRLSAFMLEDSGYNSRSQRKHWQKWQCKQITTSWKNWIYPCNRWDNYKISKCKSLNERLRDDHLVEIVSPFWHVNPHSRKYRIRCWINQTVCLMHRSTSVVQIWEVCMSVA